MEKPLQLYQFFLFHLLEIVVASCDPYDPMSDGHHHIPATKLRLWDVGGGWPCLIWRLGGVGVWSMVMVLVLYAI